MSYRDICRVTLKSTEAASYLGISYWLLIQLVKQHKLPCIRLGNRILFREESLKQYLSKLELESISESNQIEESYGRLRRIDN